MKTTMRTLILSLALLISCILILSACTSSPFHTHKYGEWQVITPATCSAEGQQERACKCGTTEKSSIAMVAHTEVTLPAFEPTCTKNGATEGRGCSQCPEVMVEQQAIPALGHDLDPETYTCATCQETLREVASKNDFSAYNGSFDAVILLDKCIDTSHSSDEWTLEIAPSTSYVRLVGTAGKTYNLCIRVNDARENAFTLDLVDVSLATTQKSPVIQANNTQQLSIRFFGEECQIVGRTGDSGRNGSVVKLSMHGDNGSSGEIAIQSGGAVHLFVEADLVMISGGRGGAGGNGMDAAPSPQSGGNGGNGGDGARAVEASSIDIYIGEEYTKNNIDLRGGHGGAGGDGGDKFLIGKDGANGADGTWATPTNVEPTYHE